MLHGDQPRVRYNRNDNDGESRWQKLLIEKHPLMHNFICAPSTALIRIDILRYFHVTRLQEVYQWVPPALSQ